MEIVCFGRQICISLYIIINIHIVPWVITQRTTKSLKGITYQSLLIHWRHFIELY